MKEKNKKKEKKKKMKDLKKKVIRKFVLKNYQSECDSEEIVEEKIQYFLQKTIGSNEKGQVGLIDGGKLLTITRKGNIFGPS